MSLPNVDPLGQFSAPPVPGAPCGPGGPASPFGPAGPVAPSLPSAPFSPFDPASPFGPGGPAGPGSPFGPVAPSPALIVTVLDGSALPVPSAVATKAPHAPARIRPAPTPMKVVVSTSLKYRISFLIKSSIRCLLSSIFRNVPKLVVRPDLEGVFQFLDTLITVVVGLVLRPSQREQHGQNARHSREERAPGSRVCRQWAECQHSATLNSLH